MSLYFVSAAEIDCGDVLEDKDIKGLYPLRAARELRGGDLIGILLTLKQVILNNTIRLL